MALPRYEWDWTTSKQFFESKYSQYWPDYWSEKKNAVKRITNFNHKGLYDFNESNKILYDSYNYFDFSIKESDWVISNHVQKSLIKGILLYDALIYDSSLMEYDFFYEVSGIDEDGAKRHKKNRTEAINVMTNLMKNDLLVPILIGRGFTEEEDDEFDKFTEYVMDNDPSLIKMIRRLPIGDVLDIDGLILLTQLKSLLYSKKFNASLIPDNRMYKIYVKIINMFNEKIEKVSLSSSLNTLIQASIPIFNTNNIEDFIQFKKEKCVKEFREKFWDIVSKKEENPELITEHLLRDIDDSKQEIKEISENISTVKLIWSFITIVTFPFLGIPFPANLAVSGSNFLLQQLSTDYYFEKQMEKRRWSLAFDKIKDITRNKNKKIS